MKIVLAEDDDFDEKLTRKIIGRSGIQCEILMFRDGQSVTDFLAKKGRYKSAPTPDLIVLDLGLPVKSGIEVLNEMETIPLSKRIPTVVLTGRETDEKFSKNHQLYEHFLYSKWGHMNEFLTVLKAVDDHRKNSEI